MKKSMLSFLALAITTSLSAGATAASLDVHGDIKVNGKTVIDSKGNLVQPAPAVDPLLVDMAEYEPAPNAKLTYQRTLNGVVETSVISYEDGREVSTTITQPSGNVVWGAERVLQANGEVEVTTTTEVCVKMVRMNIEASSGFNPTTVGSTISRFDKFSSEILNSSCVDDVAGTISHEIELYHLVPLAKYDYQYGEGNTLKDCVFVELDVPWNKDQHEYRTYCKGVGMVEYGDKDNPYQLVSFE
ncbi:hypothetical protein [Photobacterium sanguinicancri]|uniref:hypothetical protein n=2 Tax=Pseudomonadota TaxID=1224 RepID=UPI0026E44A11|nr:hypothetical protein [Photobacterium sanguinicancri]MDO6496791.1 hypothetical protein [Photobacterium sanguinicancri]